MTSKLKDCWYFAPQNLATPDGKTLAMDSFLLEAKDPTSIVFREITQNVLDARQHDYGSGRRKTATLNIRVLDPSTGMTESILDKYTEPLKPRLSAANHDSDLLSKDFLGALIIEEFETSGLLGETENSRFSVDEENQRWNNFWHGEGKEIKGGRDLGRRGQGKITYHLTSGSAAVLALSNQESGKSGLLFGKCIFKKTFEYASEHFNRHAFWCDQKNVNGDVQPIPISDPAVISEFISDFQISRTTEPGTSWVIPYVPLDEFTKLRIIQVVVSEFFIAILNGDIIFDVCGERVDSTSLHSIIDTCSVFTGEKSEYARWLINAMVTKPNEISLAENWFVSSDAPASEDALDDSELDQCRKSFDAGETITFNVPIPIVKKDGTKVSSNVTVFLEYQPDATATHEIYSRDSLMIEEERWLRDAPGRFFGALLADEDEIVDFLGCAEEASHLKWNPQLPDLRDKYTDPNSTLSMVRRSLPALAKLLLEQENRIYDDVFNDIMAIPGPDLRKKKKKKKKPKPGPGPGPSPSSSQPLFSIDQVGGDLTISAGPGFSKISCPETINFALAYKTLEGTGDSFTAYHRFDFDFSNTKTHKMSEKNCAVVSSDLNLIELRIDNPSFQLSVSGFSENSLALQVRR